MSIDRRSEVLEELAQAIRETEIPGSPSIRKVSVEPYLDADGEPTLKALIVFEGAPGDGWPAELTHLLRRQANRLAAEKNLNEYVYITLFTEQEFKDRESPDDTRAAQAPTSATGRRPPLPPPADTHPNPSEAGEFSTAQPWSGPIVQGAGQHDHRRELTMYIAELKVSGVRGFSGDRSVDLRLTRPDGSHAGWTVLAGRNGSGKTTLLRALALAMAGPSVARSLIPSFDGWISEGLSEASVEAKVLDGNRARWGSGWSEARPFPARLTWSREPTDDPEGEDYEPHPILRGHGGDALRGPWADNPRGWFLAGYGPFRRLVGGSADAQRLMLSTGPVSRLASLFHEDASLAESVSWLIDLHLRRLEGRPGAEGLLLFVTNLLNDGLLPDGFQVHRVDSEGLWAKRDGQTIPLRELSDGYRTVTALVLDLVRQVNQMFPKELLSWTIARNGRLRPSDDPKPRPVIDIPGVVLIDEIDVHLHVSWQKKIGEWLKSHFPAIQFIVTSHSPYICQSADPGGLIRLAGVDENVPPRVVDEDLYERVVYGSGDDALLTDLFGIDSPYSNHAEEMRRRLTGLERAVLRGRATPEELREYEHLRETLSSSLTARVDEVAARISDTP